MADTETMWNVDMEVNLFHAMRRHKPVGVNRYFQMMYLHERLNNAGNRKISSLQIWQHLSEMYDLQALNESEITPFPNKPVDFVLPDSDYRDLMEKSFPRVEKSSPVCDEFTTAKVPKVEPRGVFLNDRNRSDSKTLSKSDSKGSITPQVKESKSEKGTSTAHGKEAKIEKGTTTPHGKEAKIEKGTTTPHGKEAKSEKGTTTPHGKEAKSEKGTTTPHGKEAKSEKGTATPHGKDSKSDSRLGKDSKSDSKALSTPHSKDTKGDKGSTQHGGKGNKSGSQSSGASASNTPESTPKRKRTRQTNSATASPATPSELQPSKRVRR